MAIEQVGPNAWGTGGYSPTESGESRNHASTVLQGQMQQDMNVGHCEAHPNFGHSHLCGGLTEQKKIQSAQIDQMSFATARSALDLDGLEKMKSVKQSAEKGRCNVTHPFHYTRGKIETWDFIADQGLSFLEGNVVKYVVRHRSKNGKEDLLKAKQYLEKLIATEYPEK